MISPTATVAYLALFTAVGLAFLFVNLLVGKFLRPKAPNAEKLEVYECGEPTIGSSFVQFDLRFYVVALLFIIFDVEVAFFFPWATVFGKATHLMDPHLAQSDLDPKSVDYPLAQAEADLLRELGVSRPATSRSDRVAATNGAQDSSFQSDHLAVRQTARKLALMSMIDIGAFFAVLLMGFAYVWKRGDLDWVRAIARPAAEPGQPEKAEQEPVLSV